MKKTWFLLLVVFGMINAAHGSNPVVRHQDFRQKVLTLFGLSAQKEINFKRFSGTSTSNHKVKTCEVQMKSTMTSTTFDIIFPQSSGPQVSVEFTYNREITEKISGNHTKYSSHFTACHGDQYDIYRECWEYDHYEMMLKPNPNTRLVTVSFKGNNCSIKM